LNDKLVASVAGKVVRVNKLISVKPLKSRFNGEVGDVVVGRILELAPKRWKVDIKARQDAVLMLSAINLPGGVQVLIQLMDRDVKLNQMKRKCEHSSKKVTCFLQKYNHSIMMVLVQYIRVVQSIENYEMDPWLWFHPLWFDDLNHILFPCYPIGLMLFWDLMGTFGFQSISS
jgi:exosome complex RNA-binding protein Rrp4